MWGLLLLIEKKESMHCRPWAWVEVDKNMELRISTHLLSFKPPRRKGLQALGEAMNPEAHCFWIP